MPRTFGKRSTWHFPQKMSDLLLAGEKYRSLISQFDFPQGTKILYLPDNPQIDPRLSGHADLNACLLPDGSVLLAEYLEKTSIPASLEACGIHVRISSLKQGRNYPDDCGLNVVFLNGFMICNPNTADEELRKAAEEQGFRVIPVRQGYTRCSVLPLSDRILVTSDEGIRRALSDPKFYVISATNSEIQLDGFPNGFIGGCGFRLSDDTVYFTGRLDAIDPEARIRQLAAKQNIPIKELNGTAPTDIGGVIVIPLPERI